jgi:hypothetical protein
MTNITTFSGANLPSVQSLSGALRSIQAEVGPSGSVILKMDKTGHWVFGADQTEVEEGSVWAANPFSFVHGYIAWGNGEVLGEKLVPVSEPLPELEPAPAGAARGWEMQVGMMLVCTGGEDKDMQARFTTTSVGGKRAVQALAVAIADQVETDQNNPVPLLILDNEQYMHKTYGRIFTPIFKIDRWVPMDTDTVSNEGEGDAEAEAAAEPKTPEVTRRRRRVA